MIGISLLKVLDFEMGRQKFDANDLKYFSNQAKLSIASLALFVLYLMIYKIKLSYFS